MVCNLYNQTRAVDAMRSLFAGLDNRIGNMHLGDIYPDGMAVILQLDGATPVLQMARWGLPAHIVNALPSRGSLRLPQAS